jgi:hypothetical protein
MRGAGTSRQGEQKESQPVIDDDAYSKSSGHTEARANSPGWTCTTITYVLSILKREADTTEVTRVERHVVRIYPSTESGREEARTVGTVSPGSSTYIGCQGTRG